MIQSMFRMYRNGPLDLVSAVQSWANPGLPCVLTAVLMLPHRSVALGSLGRCPRSTQACKSTSSGPERPLCAVGMWAAEAEARTTACLGWVATPAPAADVWRLALSLGPPGAQGHSRAVARCYVEPLVQGQLPESQLLRGVSQVVLEDPSPHPASLAHAWWVHRSWWCPPRGTREASGLSHSPWPCQELVVSTV